MVLHRVEISSLALQDVEEIYLWLTEQYGNEVSMYWYNGLFEVISSLNHLPRRCPLAPESKELNREIRQLLYSKGRIVFGVENALAGTDLVKIYRVRHQAQKGLNLGDFPIKP